MNEACFYALTPAHPFNYSRVMQDPKGDHGTYSMRWFRTITYHLQHTGGFLRLATERGRVYWLAQNETEHTTPDWKIHFSIAPRGEWDADIGAAWDILAALFMERCCEVGMKARYDRWDDPGQLGRELTVYVFRHAHEYDDGHQGGPMEGLSPEGQFHLHHLGYEHEAHYDTGFWVRFIQEAERRLAAAGLQSAGVASGDLGIPGCRFASVRNEAFAPVVDPDWEEGMPAYLKKKLMYPPNELGWNAVGHPNPLEEAIGILTDTVPLPPC
eukprot:TRINITY_DN44144_c0_g1_i1.p1 TRINITY_DN44144_c0_g1~~TRINITY_DN44144_c0_g1_i1.p1  ORF type:complete len:270 (-),score=48.99 TRINITY_DN44144_c0_g1_i1:98-907(-)